MSIMGKIADIKLLDGYIPSEEEEYMVPEQRAFFLRLLLEWRQQLTDDADKTLAVMTEEKAIFADPTDRASLETDRNFELRTRDRERKLIAKIDNTMAMIEADEYGFCEECGVEIGLKRLEARPVTDLCIGCKTRAERKEKINLAAKEVEEEES